MDTHGNRIAQEGVTRCWCGVKYWEGDRCVGCNSPVEDNWFAGIGGTELYAEQERDFQARLDFYNMEAMGFDV